MRLPRGPVIVAGEVSRDWRAAFGPGQPRTPPEAMPGRDWRRFFADIGGGVIPQGPLYGADGRMTRNWRVWLEAI